MVTVLPKGLHKAIEPANDNLKSMFDSTKL